jgi:hypothetical protein
MLFRTEHGFAPGVWATRNVYRDPARSCRGRFEKPDVVDAPALYRTFRDKKDGYIEVVLKPR